MVCCICVEMEEICVIFLDIVCWVFSEYGYVVILMDDLIVQVGLIRGVLYYYFGDKKGLLVVVVVQFDVEIDQCLQVISDVVDDVWEGFVQCCCVYFEMVLELEIQCIVLCDVCVVFGGVLLDLQCYCVYLMQYLIEYLVVQGVVVLVNVQVLVLLIYGSLVEVVFWIVEGEDGDVCLWQVMVVLEMLLCGLKLVG